MNLVKVNLQKEFDPKYHFSCQFTVDLISMNATDFIITSTYQEIAGRFVFHKTFRLKLVKVVMRFMSYYAYRHFL